ncbi:MAG TPA: response regulator [Candidatus Nitrosocosmicus sp.]|nr:response regulator [Candidatus Nitrosocosmicus sp.]
MISQTTEEKNMPERSRVLVIDDNKDITEMIKDFFDSEDIECKIINEGKEGLDEIRKNNGYYNLILLDLTMPDFSGWDVFKKVKEEDLLKSNNIIIFTASTKTNNEIGEMINEGAKFVLRKPFSLNDLISIVDKYTK